MHHFISSWKLDPTLPWRSLGLIALKGHFCSNLGATPGRGVAGRKSAEEGSFAVPHLPPDPHRLLHGTSYSGQARSVTPQARLFHAC